MFGRPASFGIVLATILSQSAIAGPATDDGAQKLLRTFQTYLGQTVTGSMAVKPDGDAYLVSLDIEKVLKPFAADGLDVQTSAWSFHVADQDDGTFRVNDVTVPPIAVAMKGSTIAYKFGDMHFDGIFDPKLGGFTKADTVIAQFSMEQLTKDVLAHVTESNIEGHQTGVATGPGVGSMRQHFTIGGLSEQVGSASGKGTRIAIGMGPSVGDLNADGLRNQAIWDLLSFFVAHQGREAIVADKARLQSLLDAALPLVDKLEESVTAKELAVDTPAGRFALGDVGMKVATTGLVPQGRYSLTLGAGKPTIPDGALKPWMMKLMPTDFSIGADLVGLDLEGVARIVIADFDPATKDLLPPASVQKLDQALWVGGPLKLTFQPSHVASALYTIEMTGEATIWRAGPPALHMLVSAKGIDATMDALNAARETDPTAGQAVLALATAKGFGKVDASGAMQWDIAFGGGGMTVNGMKVGH